MNQLGAMLMLWLLPLRLDPVSVAGVALIGAADKKSETAALQEITNNLRARLGITPIVQVTLVDHNPLVMSVETLGGRIGPFVITVDRDFISELGHDEIEASIAHELGHVQNVGIVPQSCGKCAAPSTGQAGSKPLHVLRLTPARAAIPAPRHSATSFPNARRVASRAPASCLLPQRCSLTD